MKRSKGKQPVKPGPSKKARREPAPPVHSRRTRATAARQVSDHVPHTHRREDTESPLSSVPEATPSPVPEEVSEKEEEEEEKEEEEEEEEDEEEEEEEEEEQDDEPYG
jgi:TATA-binding protein-associated factor Taf7